MERDFRKEVQDLIGGKVLFDAPMKRYTSMKVGGPADVLIYPEDVEQLKTVVLHARRKRIPLFILGNGTNLVVGDRGIRGWVVSLTRGLKRIDLEGDVVEAEAGIPLQRLHQFSARQGFSGLETFAGIPGTVGGGLAMNAGAWGTEMKDVVRSVSFFNENGEAVERSSSRLKFSYRKLDFPASWIILKGRFQLRRAPKEEILERMKAYSEKRQQKHPLTYPSAGSIFKNPKEGPAGRWIEEAGLKGARRGQAMVSERHANFIVNLGKATAGEVIDLMNWVERRVYAEKGISLEREVKVIGE